MSTSDSYAWLESRIERVLIWFVRIVLSALLVLALLRQGFLEALALAVILAIHSVVYWAVSRVKLGPWRHWAVTLVDVVLGGTAFYLTGNVAGQAGVLGFCLAGIVAARLGLWWALAVNGVLWFLFTFPFVHSWIWLGERFPPTIVANLFIYLALTFTVNYLVSVEARQTRITRDASVRLQQLSTVYEVGRTVSSTLDLESVLNMVVAKAVEILNAEAGSLLLLDDTGDGEPGELVFRVALGPAATSLVGRRLPPGEGVAGAVFLAGEGQFVNNVHIDPRWYAAPDVNTGLETRSILCVPLISRDRTIGVLEVINKRDASLFDEEDLQLLSTFAAQAAVALENARLYDKVHSLYERTDEALNKRLWELATIEEIDHELGTSLDYDHVINLVLRRATEACKATSGAIGILKPDGRRLEVRFWHAHQPVQPGTAEWPLDRGIVGRVVRTGQPALVADVTTDPDYEVHMPTTRSEVAVPVKREDRVIGVLNLESDRLAAFTEDDLHFVEHLADHAGIAIENAHLFQEEQRRAADLATLNQVSAAISSVLDPNEVLKTIVDSVIQVAGCQKAAIFELDAAHNRVSLRMSQGLSEVYVAAAQDIEVTPDSRAQVLLGDDPLVVTDIETDPRLTDFVPMARAEGFRALADVPLKGREVVLGEFTVYYTEPHDFSAMELETLKTFANQAAIALENARLFQQERQRVRMLSAVSEISREIRAGLDLERTLSLILDRVKDLVDYYIAEICLWDESQQLMVTRASAGDPRYTARTGGIYRLDEGFTGWIARHQQQLLVPDIAAREDVRPKVTADDTPLRSYMGLPLNTGETFVGTLELASDRRGFYTKDALEILQTFADQAAVVIQSARLHEETQQRFEQTQHLLQAQQRQLRELGILFETSAAVSSSLSLNEVLRAVARHMAHALNVSSCSISDWNPATDTVTTLVAEATTPDLAPSLSTGDVGESYSLNNYPATAQALHDRQPCVIQLSDPKADPAERELLAQMSQRSLLMMPLVARDRVVGLAELYESRHERRFSEDDIRLCQAMASQAAIAIENARLYEQTDERLQASVDELMALQRITQELGATLDRDSILQVVLAAAIQTAGATYGNVMLMDLDTGQFVLRMAEGYSAEEWAAIEELLLDPSGNSIIWQVVERGQALIVDDATQESWLVCVRGDTRSALVVPIFYQDAIVGLINLRHTEVGAFDQEDLTFVQALAEQAAVAIGNALRFEDQIRVNNALRWRTEQMDSLLQVSQKLRTDVPLEETLEEVAYAIQETVGFNVVMISVVEDLQSATPMLRRAAAAGLPLDVFEEAKQIRQPLERYERILREEYQQGLCYFFPFQQEEDWAAELHTITPMPKTEEWAEGQWHSRDLLLAPLWGAGGRLLGHISVDEPRDGRRPSRRVVEVLAIFANQAAIAVENAYLYADVQRRADDVTLINEVGRALTQVFEPAQVLDIVVKGVGLLLQCELSAVFQVDPFDGKFAAVASYGVDLAQMAGLRFALGEGLVGHVAATRAPLLVPDADQEPRFVQGPMPLGSMMLVPIIAGQQVIGVLTAGSTRNYALTQVDQVLLTTLADQAAVALESARLFDGTERAAERLSLLNEIGRRAAAQLAFQEMLETTVQALHQHLGFFRVAVFLVDEEARELYVAAANDEFLSVIPPGYRQKMGEGLIGTTAATGRTMLENQASLDERFLRAGEWSSPSSLAVPIKTAGRVIGVLEAEADRPRAFTDEDAAALEIAADQLAVAIQNARLFEETQRRVAELATINQIGRAISGALDASQLADLIYSQVSNLLDTRNFHIALYDSDTELIHVQFLVEHGQRQPPVVLNLGQGLTSHLVRTGQPILLTHGSEEFLREHNLTLEREPAKSWLGVPMIAEDRVIGAIAVQSFDKEGVFDVGHLELLTTIAGQAAIAFQNAALFQERQQRIRQLAVVNEMAQAVSSTLELDELLEVVYHQVSRIVDTTNFYIALYDDEKDEIFFPFVVDPERREDWRRRKGGVGLTGRVIAEGKPLLLPAGAAGVYQEAGREVKAGLCRSWLGVPMIAEDKVLGVIAVQSYEKEYLYHEEHLNLLSTVAAQVAVAVRNAQLYQQIVRFSSELEETVRARTRDLEQALDELTSERDRAETLYRITSELGATLDLERVLQRALQLFSDALGIDHGTVTLLDQESGYLYLRATLDEDRKPVREGSRTSLKQGVGLAGWVLENRRPVLVSDVTEDPRWIELDGREVNVRSVVAAPLSLGGGDILGVLTLGHPEADYFTKEHLQVVSAAAAQVAIAVNNSDLYAFITDQADQLGSLVQAQQAETAKNRAILESIADGVLVLDHNGRVLLVNPAAEEMLGFAAMALEGGHFRHMLGLGETPTHRELAQLLYTELRNGLEAAEKDELRFQAGTVRLEAGERVLAMNVAPLITTLGGSPGLVAALRDISREAEVERLKNEFISTVSHELRTPMTSIKGYTDLLFLGMAGGLTDAQRSFLQIIKSNADRLTALVNDILDISRIETGRMRLTIEPLDMGAIITQVVTAFQEQYREKDLTLEWEEPEDLPPVRGDAARVTQVLNNLIANAWQYTPSGGHVSVSVEALDRFLRVDVADTGIGITSDDVNRIFDRFYRVDHPIVQEAGGTGLGLSIVKMFVEMLGGEIWVESELGVGSTFSFVLPQITAEVPEVTAQLLTTEPPVVVSRRPKILVVEDDRDLALLLRRQLESEGYQVVLAGGGEDALWLATEEKPQLITLDIMLPDLDGFAVLEQLKDNPVTAPIPVVITSVLAESDQGYALGAVDYVVKPFSEEKLLESVRQALAPFDRTEPYRLLVVDDDPDILSFMNEALSLHGYQVSTATSGREALAQVEESPPELILLDLRMPGMDGYEVIRQLKKDDATRPIPVIVITASPVDKERDKVRLLGMGASQYLTKPLSIEALIREIKKAIVEKQPE